MYVCGDDGVFICAIILVCLRAYVFTLTIRYGLIICLVSADMWSISIEIENGGNCPIIESSFNWDEPQNTSPQSVY